MHVLYMNFKIYVRIFKTKSQLKIVKNTKLCNNKYRVNYTINK